MKTLIAFGLFATIFVSCHPNASPGGEADDLKEEEQASGSASDADSDADADLETDGSQMGDAPGDADDETDSETEWPTDTGGEEGSTDADSGVDTDTASDTETTTEPGAMLFCSDFSAIYSHCEPEEIPPCEGGVLSGDFTITNGAQLANLAQAIESAAVQGRTKMTGSLTIRSNTLQNLNGLAKLTCIEKDLKIGECVSGGGMGSSCNGNARLNNLEGLRGLVSVGSLEIIRNSALSSLNGLRNLKIIRGDLQLMGNSRLTNLSGLGQLTAIEGSFRTDGYCGKGELTCVTNYLDNLDGLESLTSVGEDLNLHEIVSLKNINSLENLTCIGGNLSISKQTALGSLQGLKNLVSIGGDLAIVIDVDGATGSAALRDLRGLEKLAFVGGNVVIQDNPSLNSLNGMGQATIGGMLRIIRNDSLVDLEGLGGLNAICGHMFVEINGSLKSLRGLNEGLRSIVGYDDEPKSLGGLSVTSNPNLVDLHGLEGIASLGANGLEIYSNYNLVDISALGNLQDVENKIVINQNNSLTDLSSLGDIVFSPYSPEVPPHLEIKENTNLPTCQAELLKQRLITSEVLNDVSICGNQADDCGSLTCP